MMTQSQAPTPGSTWSVLSQIEQTQVGVNNQLVKGRLVTITTGAGNTGSTFIADQDYADVAKVKAALATLAAQMDAVSALTHAS